MWQAVADELPRHNVTSKIEAVYEAELPNLPPQVAA